MKKLTHPVTQTLRGMFNGRGHTEEKRAPTLFHDEHAAGRQRGKDFVTCCPRFGRRFWSGPEVHNQELEPVVGHQPVNTRFQTNPSLCGRIVLRAPDLVKQPWPQCNPTPLKRGRGKVSTGAVGAAFLSASAR